MVSYNYNKTGVPVCARQLRRYRLTGENRQGGT